MKVELLCGGGIKNAFKELGIEATKTYHGKNDPHYQVWEIEKSDIIKLTEPIEWKDNWGWWRFAKGSNMGTACSVFCVNNHELIAWDGPYREELMDAWYDESNEEKAAYHYSMKEYIEAQMPHEYDTLSDYFIGELSISTESNVCALAVDLARANGITMTKLFETYEG